jgi:RNA polymerase sigma-70 factor (ECF subfamily)
MLVLLESLSPEQRAVLLLHDVFDYGYPGIAAVVGKSEDNVRQLASRQTPRRAAPAPLPNDARAARRAGATVLRGRRGPRSVGSR